MAELYIDNDMAIRLIGLKNAVDDTFVNNGTVLARVFDATPTQLGGDFSMSYQTGTNGDYSGQIPSSLALVDNATYQIEVVAIGDGLTATFRQFFQAGQRSGFSC